MPAAEATDTDRVLEQVREVLSPPAEWGEPDGWPGEIEAAVLDSVFSIRARYGGPHTGVRAVVARWRADRYQPVDDLEALASVTNTGGLAELLDNRQTLHGGTTKAAGVVTVARNLLDVGVRHAADVGAPAARFAWCAVPGLTEVTWSYVLMLLGTPGVKADRMVRRFVDDSLGRSASAAEAETLLQAAADNLGVTATQLDHAVWSWQRTQQR